MKLTPDQFSDPDDPETCPACGGPGVFLGVLGHLAHYRCRDCGMGFAAKPIRGEE